MNDRLPSQEFQGGVVVDVGPTGRLADRPAMPVVRVLAKTHVGDEQQLGHGPFGGADGLGDDARLAGGVGAGGVFFRRNAEKEDAAQSQVGRGPDFVDELVGRELIIARHGRHLFADFLSRRTNSGNTRLAAASRVSWTSRRTAG